MKPLLFLLLLIALIPVSFVLLYHHSGKPTGAAQARGKSSTIKPSRPQTVLSDAKNKASIAKRFALQKGFSTRIAFLLNMRLPSGRKRFFIYDLQKDSVLAEGLVAHGSCNKRFLESAQFSNTVGCGCSSVGKYKIGEVYTGGFGKAFKLYGLDSSNSNAYLRNVVLHAYDCIPDAECYPYPICNSLGCTMVSYAFFKTAASFIKKEKKPVLLWLYD